MWKQEISEEVHIPENKKLYYLTIFTKCKLVFKILLKNNLCTFKKEKTNINCQIQLRWFIIFGLIDLMIHNLIFRELKLHGLLHLSMLISWWAMLPLVEYERTEYAVRLLHTLTASQWTTGTYGGKGKDRNYHSNNKYIYNCSH